MPVGLWMFGNVGPAALSFLAGFFLGLGRTEILVALVVADLVWQLTAKCAVFRGGAQVPKGDEQRQLAEDQWGDSGIPARFTAMPSGPTAPIHLFANKHTFETSLASATIMAMHKPTHQPDREKAGDYPFSWHLHGRKRTFEVRFQVRFKRAPHGQLFIAGVNNEYKPIGVAERALNSMIVSGVKKIAGEIHQTFGDNPAALAEGSEVEEPMILMPLTFSDRFIESAVGHEPNLSDDLSGFGVLRTNNTSAYRRHVENAMAHISPDTVYTFCVWAPARFFDVVKYRVLPPVGGHVEAELTLGGPPFHAGLVQLTDCENGETRLVPSRLTFLFRVALWSTLKPPAPKFFERTRARPR